MLALRRDGRFRDAFAYDKMQRCVMLMQSFRQMVDNFEPRPVLDSDVSALQEMLQKSGLEKIGESAIHQAVNLRATEWSFHPIRDYLSPLKWDETPCLETWLSSYLGAEDSKYNRAIGTMFLVMMVARIFKNLSH